MKNLLLFALLAFGLSLSSQAAAHAPAGATVIKVTAYGIQFCSSTYPYVATGKLYPYGSFIFQVSATDSTMVSLLYPAGMATAQYPYTAKAMVYTQPKSYTTYWNGDTDAGFGSTYEFYSYFKKWMLPH